MNVIITGGAGLIGFHLSRFHAERGDRVTIVDNLFKSGGRIDADLERLLKSAGVDYVGIDLTRPLDPSGLTWNADVVYHLAAINGTRLFYEIPYQVARGNLVMTLNVLSALEGRSVGRLVYASSSEVYAGAEGVAALTIPTDETAPVVFPQPTDDRFSYGTSKFMGEFLCLRFGREFDVPVSVVRYHNVYGPRMGDKHVMPELLARIRAGEEPLRVYGGEETRSFCYVDDAVEATWRVATTAECIGEVVHVGNGAEEISIRALAALMMEEMGRRCEIVEGGRRSGSVSRRCPDTTKLRRLTGFEARVDLKRGLARTIAWYLGRPGGGRSERGRGREREGAR